MRNFRILRQMLPELSERQWQILVLRVRGVTCKEVAARLGVSVKTVDTHQHALFLKLKVGTVAELVHLCYAAGAIRYEDETR